MTKNRYKNNERLVCLYIARSYGRQLLVGLVGNAEVTEHVLDDNPDHTREVYDLFGDEPKLDEDGLYRVYVRMEKVLEPNEVAVHYYINDVERIEKLHDGRSW